MCLKKFLATVLTTASLAGFSTSAQAQNGGDCGLPEHAAMQSWFPHEQTPAPSVNLVSDTNCAFHIWSTQMFLWLTQNDPATSQPRFLSFYTLDEVFAPKSASGDSAPRSTPLLRLSPKLAKSDATDLEAFHQAGSAGVLVDQAGRSVYYTQLFNREFYDFVRGKFFDPGEGGTFQPALMAQATGLTDFIAPGAMELKVSWKIVSDDAKTDFYTTKAELHLLTEVDGKIVVDPDKTQQVTVAMVGLHVAGVVADHPELIWATFEHRNNAPDLPKGMEVNSPEPVSNAAWTFYSPDTPAKDANQNPGGKLTLDSATQTLSPVTQVFRRFAYGTITGGANADTNVANITAINSFLDQNFQPVASGWKNYMEIGAIWTLPNSLEPNQYPVQQLRGSTMLSNATMETFTQNEAQCFSCHNTLPIWETIKGHRIKLPGTNFNLSHALVQEYFRTMATSLGMRVRPMR